MFNYELKLVDSSRLIADIIVADIGNNTEKYAEILELTLRDEYPLSMRASRVLALATRNDTSLLLPHLQRVIDTLGSLKVEGVKRGFLYILAELPLELNEEMLGIVVDHCFTWLNDAKEAIAIRYYAIEILVKVVFRYPELKTELVESLQIILENDTKVLHAKSRKALKLLLRI